MLKPFKFLWVCVVLLSFFSSAAAYSFVPAENSSNLALRWEKKVISVAVSASLLKSPNIKTEEDVIKIIRRSFKAWEDVADITFKEVLTDSQSVSPAGKTGDGISLITIAPTSENIVFFGSEASESAARTRVFYDHQNRITEADIVLNPFTQFSTDGTPGMFDLEAVLTHEIGHLLGLEHSTVIGGTMFEHQGKNGIFNLPNFGPRTLAADDVAKIQAIYGAKEAGESCCGSVTGKIQVGNGGSRTSNVLQIWAEDALTGRVISAVQSAKDGSFSLTGLPFARYKILVRDQKNPSFSAVTIRELDVEKHAETKIEQKVTFRKKDFDLQFIGFNGQLSPIAVPVNKGKPYVIYAAGKNLDPKQLEIGIDSPYFTVTRGSFQKHDYGKDLSVFSFEIRVKDDAPSGEYSLYVQSKDGSRSYFVGGLTVEEFENPWLSRLF